MKLKFKKGLSIAFFALIAASFANAQEACLTYVVSKEIPKSIGYALDDVPYKLSAAIQLDTESFGVIKSKWNNPKVVKISFGLSGGTSEVPVTTYQDITVWVRETVDGEILYSKSVNKEDVALRSWNDVTVDFPFPDGDSFFVGYTITANGTPIGCDGSQSADKRASWFKGGDDKWESATVSGNICIKAYVSGEYKYQNDVALDQVLVPEYIKTGSKFSVGGIVYNRGSQEIKSFDVVCKSGDKTLAQKSFSGLSIVSDTCTTFKVSDIVCNEAGEQEIKIILSNVNGKADEDNSDNELTSSALSATDYAPRKVLMEHFTSQYCPNCPAGLAMLEKAIEGYEDRVVWTAHRVGYQADTYTIDKSYNFAGFFNSYQTFNPGIMLDRTNLGAFGVIGADRLATSPGPIFSIGGVEEVREMFDECLNVPSPIEITNIDQSYSGDRLMIIVKGKKLQPLQGNPSCSLFLNENKVRNEDHILRDILNTSPYYGDAIKFNEDGTFSKAYSIELPSNWKKANMEVIAIVSNVDREGNPNNYMVYNTESQPLLDNVGIYSELMDAIQVYGMDGKVYVNGEYTALEVYTVEGKQIENNDLSSGIYLVKVVSNNKVITKKIVL